MFQQNDKPKTTDAANSPAITIISEGTRIEGNITVQNDFRLGGVVEGRVTVSGKCIVASTAAVTGDLEASDMDIAGTIDGDIISQNRVTLRKTAVVKGDLRTSVFTVEEGARIDGRIQMTSKTGA